MASFASRVKVNWQIDPNPLMSHAAVVAADAIRQLELEGLKIPHYRYSHGSARSTCA